MKSVLRVFVTVVMVTSIIGLPLKASAAEPLPEIREDEVECVGGREGVKAWLGCIRHDFGMDRPLTEFVEALVDEYGMVDESYFWDFLSEMYWDEVPEEKRVYPKNSGTENDETSMEPEINEPPLKPEINDAPINLETDTDGNHWQVDQMTWITDDNDLRYAEERWATDDHDDLLVIELEEIIVYVESTEVLTDTADVTDGLDTGEISAEVYTTNGADSTSIVNDGAEGLTLVSDVNQAR